MPPTHGGHRGRSGGCHDPRCRAGDRGAAGGETAVAPHAGLERTARRIRDAAIRRRYVALAHAVADATTAGKLRSVAGGGDTVAALRHAGVMDRISYVSTAGGAFLEWLEGRMLPGIQALQSLEGVIFPA
jgi:hypothetical protein